MQDTFRARTLCLACPGIHVIGLAVPPAASGLVHPLCHRPPITMDTLSGEASLYTLRNNTMHWENSFTMVPHLYLRLATCGSSKWHLFFYTVIVLLICVCFFLSGSICVSVTLCVCHTVTYSPANFVSHCARGNQSARACEIKSETASSHSVKKNRARHFWVEDRCLYYVFKSILLSFSLS